MSDGSEYHVLERAAIFHRLRAVTQIPSGSVIFSEKGNAFRNHNGPIIPRLHDAHTITYHHLIHHIISPSDDHFHVVSKRNSRKYMGKWDGVLGDDVESDLCLLGYLTHTDPRAVQGYFERNLFLGRDPPTAKKMLGSL